MSISCTREETLCEHASSKKVEHILWRQTHWGFWISGGGPLENKSDCAQIDGWEIWSNFRRTPGVLKEFILWSSIVVVAIVVVWLQQMFEEKDLPKPKFISCQHHVLDCILRVVMGDGSSKSPNIEYFVQSMVRNYDKLKATFSNSKTNQGNEWLERRQGFFITLHLCFVTSLRGIRSSLWSSQTSAMHIENLVQF